MRVLGIRTLCAAVTFLALMVAEQGMAESPFELATRGDAAVADAASTIAVEAEEESPSITPASFLEADEQPIMGESAAGRAAGSAPQSRSPTPSPTPRSSDDMLGLLRGSAASRYHSSLAYSAPAMFGKSFQVPASLVVVLEGQGGFVDLPLAGSGGRLDVADNNKPITMDRVYVLYNHFHNAIGVDLPNIGEIRETATFSVNRCTFGFEKALLNGRWSLEMRLPVSNNVNWTWDSLSSTGPSLVGQSVGNLAVILKRMVYETEDTALAVGLGIDTPTGGSARFGMTSYTMCHVSDNAVHLVPYVGLLRTPGRLFYQGFFHVDVPTNGNRVSSAYLSHEHEDITAGYLTEQTLMQVDLSGGLWLYRNQSARRLTGLAAVAEFHYTSTLNDTTVVSIWQREQQMFAMDVCNRRNRMDVVNMTIGLHADLADNTACRVGAVFPLGNRSDRTFETEIQAQLERRF